MAAFFRLVSLIGVMSAGFYVLYLTQSRLSEPQSLTESESSKPAPVTLGAEGEISAHSDLEMSWKALESNVASSETAVPGSADSPEMFSASSTSAPTVVSAADPDDSRGIDFRDSTNRAANSDDPGLGIVSAAVTNAEPDVIALTANENPFPADAPPQPTATERAPSLENIDPFDAQDPFSDQVGPSQKPAPLPEQAADEFDPFGDDVTEPKPSTTEKPPEDFPELEAVTERPVSDQNSELAKDRVNPFPAEGSFAPFAEESPDKADSPKPAETTVPVKKPAVSPDPFADAFPDFPAETTPADKKPSENSPLAPKPIPAVDPFGEEFPKLETADEKPAERKPLEPAKTPTPSIDPFGENVGEKASSPSPPADFPEFPEALSTTDTPVKESAAARPANALDSEFDPFVQEAPAPKPVDNVEKSQPTPTADDFPAFEPTESAATEAPPARARSLPSRDEFTDLDAKLKQRVEEDERSREVAPELPADAPRPLPEGEGSSPRSSSEPSSPEELRSAPIGIVPSLTDLEGDGVVTPEVPRKVQLPYLEIQKSAPETAILNQPFVYTILVKNVGEAAADEVTVQDQIPKGANLTGTIPQAELVGRRLVWRLGRIGPGEEQQVAVRVVPVDSGPIGSVATVNFVAEVGAETVVERPEVQFRMTLPANADVGEVVECQFEIENNGSEIVTGMVLRDIIPEGLHHPAGSDLENPLGDLKPGEKLSESLELKVMQPGKHVNQAVLTAEGGLEIKQQAHIEAAGNRLVILRRGPKERFVGRPAVFQNIVQNSSQEPVRDAVVIEKLPPGMQFVQAGQGGQFHAASREIYWKIAEIKPGQAVTLEAQMTPVKPGGGESLVRVRESQGREIQTVSHTQIRSYASIGLEMSEFDQPILVGDTVVMRVEATNRGNAAAQSVQIRAQIPPTLSLMDVHGTQRMEYQTAGREVIFRTLDTLPAGATEIFELELQAAAPTRADIKVSVQAKGMSKPYMKTAAVPVYSRQ